MCGRYTLRTSPYEYLIAQSINAAERTESGPRYNVAPTQSMPVIRLTADGKGKELVALKWGLIPSWADDIKIGNRMINARADGIASKPSFRSAFKKRRCLVVADGFYEWKKEGKAKQPYFIHRKDDAPFTFAGLWERWSKGGTPVESFTIVTTEANDLMRPLHDRMPVILDQDAAEMWLDPEVESADVLTGLLVPYGGTGFEVRPVSTLVNIPKNDMPECVQAI